MTALAIAAKLLLAAGLAVLVAWLLHDYDREAGRIVDGRRRR